MEAHKITNNIYNTVKEKSVNQHTAHVQLNAIY